jgi:WD40-like Beta Propeller Repeat
VHQYSAVWSPDGGRVIFLAECGGDDEPTPWVATIDGKDIEPVRDLEIQRVGFEDSLPDPPRLIIREFVGDAGYVTAVPISPDATRITGARQRLTSVTDNISRVSAALDGRLVVSVDTNRSHIWGLPIDGKGQAVSVPKQLTSGPASDVDLSLSRDGERLAFSSQRASKFRIFYKDLATGRENELSADRSNYWSPVFSSDANGVFYERFLSTASEHSSLDYTPLSGRLAQTIWDKSYMAWPWDSSPDGKTLLVGIRNGIGKPTRGVIYQLDLSSLSATMFLEDPAFDLWEAHFSHDGRWVTFNATTRDFTQSRIFVTRFNRALMPQSKWIPITSGEWDDKPRFSSDDTRIFFLSGQSNIPHRLFAQKLTADMQADGGPVAVYPLSDEKPTRSIGFDEIGVGPRLIVFVRPEFASDIWLMEPAKGGTK